jgi:peptide/nickel transport system substrate-binding protein
MAGERDNYWTRAIQRRHSRRALIRGAALAGAGLYGAAALACKATTSTGGAKSSNQAQPSPAKGSVAALVGRTGTEPKGESPVQGGTLNWYIGANPPTFDPTQNVSVNTAYVAGAVLSRPFRYRTLFDVAASNNLDIEPDLAATAETPDGVTWTLKLRPGAKHQNIAPVNGRAVDPEDFKASFIKSTDPKSVNAGNLSMIDPAQIETPDKQTVVFKLKYPYAPFKTFLASAFYCWVMPKEAVAGAYDTAKKIIGSGPFILDSYTPDVAVNFKKNPDWFEQGRPYVDSVRVAIIPDPSARIAQFTGGHLDYLGTPLLDAVPSVIQQNPKADAIRNVGNGNGVMYYNLSDPKSPFLDIRLRQALSLAMDREAYAKGSGFGDQYIQTFSVPPNVGKWAAMAEDYPADTLQWYKYDLAKAKQLMDAAGGSKLNMRMLYPAGNPADPQLGRQADIAQAMLKQLPWNMSYTTIDYTKDWIAGGKGIGYPGGGVPADGMAWWGWSSRSSVDEYLYTFWHSKGAGNFMHVNDPEIDKGIDKARATLNEDDRLKAYKDVQRYIAAKVYVLMGMNNGLAYTFVQPRVRNYQLGDFSGIATGYWAKLWLKGT